MLRPCSCPWVPVQISPEVETVLLRVDRSPVCGYPHAEDREDGLV